MRVHFGVFDFDLETRELNREGVFVRLQAQPAQVLAVLLERADAVVTRDDLRVALWGDDVHVDFDQGLNYCIAQLRTALGDSAVSPRFIRTIPKQGYRFIAPVRRVEEAHSGQDTPNRQRGAILKWALTLGILTIVAGLFVAIRAHSALPVNIAVARFDNETGESEMNSFSDGLTQMVVARLTAGAGPRFGIIGNAALLRRPAAERDLKVIGSSLKAAYVILGQVERNSGRIRVLAHLIRLPGQTHVAVARFDRDAGDDLRTESELSGLIAADFLAHLTAPDSSSR